MNINFNDTIINRQNCKPLIVYTRSSGMDEKEICMNEKNIKIKNDNPFHYSNDF